MATLPTIVDPTMERPSSMPNLRSREHAGQWPSKLHGSKRKISPLLPRRMMAPIPVSLPRTPMSPPSAQGSQMSRSGLGGSSPRMEEELVRVISQDGDCIEIECQLPALARNMGKYIKAYVVALDYSLLKSRGAGDGIKPHKAARRRIIAEDCQCAPKVQLKKDTTSLSMKLAASPCLGGRARVMLQVVVEAATDVTFWTAIGMYVDVDDVPVDDLAVSMLKDLAEAPLPEVNEPPDVLIRQLSKCRQSEVNQCEASDKELLTALTILRRATRARNLVTEDDAEKNRLREQLEAAMARAAQLAAQVELAVHAANAEEQKRLSSEELVQKLQRDLEDERQKHAQEVAEINKALEGEKQQRLAAEEHVQQLQQILEEERQKHVQALADINKALEDEKQQRLLMEERVRRENANHFREPSNGRLSGFFDSSDTANPLQQELEAERRLREGAEKSLAEAIQENSRLKGDIEGLQKSLADAEQQRLDAEERVRKIQESLAEAEERARQLQDRLEDERRLANLDKDERLQAEEELRRKRAEEEEADRLRRAEEEERLRKQREEEDAQRNRTAAEELAKMMADEEARLLKAAEDAEEEARRRRIAEEELAKMKADEEARRLKDGEDADEEARRRRLAEEELAKMRADEAARLQAEEEARLKAEEDARLRAEEEARLAAAQEEETEEEPEGANRTRLKVHILRAEGLRAADKGGTSDPYCIVRIVGKKEDAAHPTFKTDIQLKTLDPVWNQEYTFDACTLSDEMHFEVWDDDKASIFSKGKDDLLGSGDMASWEFRPGGYEGIITLCEKQKKSFFGRKKKQPGPRTSKTGELITGPTLHVRVEVLPMLKIPGVPRCFVKLQSAHGLRSADRGGTSDPYCVCEVPGKPMTRFTSKVVKKTLNPTWDEEAELSGYSPGDSLQLQVIDDDGKRAKGDSLGTVVLTNVQFEPGGFSGELALTGDGAKEGSTVKVNIDIF